MNHLFSKHISEIGQQKEPIKKFAKGNVVPQKRTSIDESATNYLKGVIGAGREDFWIINVDKNGINRWKPLGLKSEFEYLKNNSLWVFDGVGEIKFCLNYLKSVNPNKICLIEIPNTCEVLIKNYLKSVK